MMSFTRSSCARLSRTKASGVPIFSEGGLNACRTPF